MSISFHVFMHRAAIPTAADWAAAMRAHGFTAELGTGFDPGTFNGYVPCPDERSGFEYYVEPFSASNFEFGPHGIKAISDRDIVATFRFSGRDADMRVAVAASATLAAMTRGVLFDTESRHFIAADAALAWARNERYQPLTTYRSRVARRRSKLHPLSLMRLLILLLLIALLVIYWR
jgi:hypothetical protein